MGAMVAAAAAAAGGWHNPYLNLMDDVLLTIHRFLLLQLMQSLFPGSTGILCHWIDTISIY
jgi:hypothetical protein